jgi:putative metalloprotease
MNARPIRILALCLALAALAGCRIGMSDALDAGGDLYKAANLSAEEVRELGKASAGELDGKNTIAGKNSAYVKRLGKITTGLKNEAGLQLNYKVYMTSSVNAFALPDGSIRVYSGLMDLMDDDELYFVVGHEIGHVAGGDAADKIKMAYAASGARKAAGSAGGTVGALSRSELGGIAEALVNAQFSQAQESAADKYGLGLMEKNKKNSAAAVSALRKLAVPGGKSGMFDSHPDSNARADQIESMRAK